MTKLEVLKKFIANVAEKEVSEVEGRTLKDCLRELITELGGEFELKDDTISELMNISSEKILEKMSGGGSGYKIPYITNTKEGTWNEYRHTFMDWKKLSEETDWEYDDAVPYTKEDLENWIKGHDFTDTLELDRIFYQAPFKEFPSLELPNLEWTNELFADSRVESVDDLIFPKLENADHMFSSCSDLKTVGKIIIPSTTSASGMFGYSSIENIEELDLQSLNNPTEMFALCEALSDETLNMILQALNEAPISDEYKTLATVFNSDTLIQRCKTLPIYTQLTTNGWVDGEVIEY